MLTGGDDVLLSLSGQQLNSPELLPHRYFIFYHIAANASLIAWREKHALHLQTTNKRNDNQTPFDIKKCNPLTATTVTAVGVCCINHSLLGSVQLRPAGFKGEWPDDFKGCMK